MTKEDFLTDIHSFTDEDLMQMFEAIGEELKLLDITNTAKLRAKIRPDGRIRCYNSAKHLPGVEVDGKKFIPNRGLK